MSQPILEAVNLSKTFRVPGHQGKQKLSALNGIDLSLAPGEILGILGESGCGKSTLARVLAGLIEPDAGQVTIQGRSLQEIRKEVPTALARQIQIIFQNPHTALNPALKIGSTLREVLRVLGLHRGKEDERISQVLGQVGLDEEHLQRRPEHFSGGQLQRVGIARALLAEPRILLADEAVSALDVSIQAQILNLFMDLRAELGLSMLFISHDLRVVEHVSDRVGVMYLGRMVELSPARELYARPFHPYTQGLIAAIPDPQARQRRQTALLEGDPPSPLEHHAGCAFAPRCAWAQDICTRTKPLPPQGLHQAACHFPLNKEVLHV